MIITRRIKPLSEPVELLFFLLIFHRLYQFETHTENSVFIVGTDDTESTYF